MTGLIEKINWKKNRDNIRFFIIIFFFVGGYIFFFSSQMWMPVTADASYITPVGTEKSWDDRKVIINRWEYSINQNLMEVELNIENNSYDGNNKYKFSAVDLRGRKIKTEIKVADEDWIIVQIENVPDRWSDISLRMETVKGNSGTLKLYTNINAVSKVSKIDNLDYKGYKIKSFNSEIEQMKKELNNKRKQQDKLRKQNIEINKEIERLNSDKNYKTEEEVRAIDEKIGKAQTTITTNEQTINDIDGDIEEINKRIVLKEKQIEDLNKGAAE